MVWAPNWWPPDGPRAVPMGPQTSRPLPFDTPSDKMSGKVRSRVAANAADNGTLSVNERILKECHTLYTDPENGRISCYPKFAPLVNYFHLSRTGHSVEGTARSLALHRRHLALWAALLFILTSASANWWHIAAKIRRF